MNPLFAVLIPAIIAVESDGDNCALGKHGEVGCLQITRDVVQDVNRLQNTVRFDFSDALNRERAIAMFVVYVGHYASAERIGREATAEDIARTWNGGPFGWKKEATLPYWRRVEAQLSK